MSRTHRKRGLLFLAVGVLCLTIAGGWYITNRWEDKQAGEQAAVWLDKLTAASSDTSLQQEDTPTVMVEGNGFCGRIMIDTLGVQLPVFQEWNYDRLQEAPCRYAGSIATDDMIVAAHNYKSHFGDLQSLQRNDEILFIDAVEETHRFRVQEITALDGTAVTDMTAGGWDLTLFTCTKDGTQRVTVRCKRANEQPYER